MARSLWICPRRARPEAEERQEDDQGGQADRKTDRRGAGGEGGNHRAGCFSGVFFLPLRLDSCAVLQEGILCDVFSQKCSAAWQGARGERLTVAIMLPGRQDADDWLNFMLSQKNLWPTFTTRVLSLKRSTHRSLVESGAGYRPSICGWKSSWGGECWLTECTPGLPLGSPKKNLKPCCLTV